MYKTSFTLCALSLLLAACGGGGSGSPAVQATDTDNPAGTAGNNGYATIQLPDIESDGLSSYQITINGKTYTHNNKSIDISNLNKGLTTLPFTAEATYTDTGQQAYQEKLDGDVRIYKQDYSVLLGTYLKNQYRSNNGYAAEAVNEFTIDNIEGRITPFAALPSSGRYTYTGQAFTHNETGNLSYTADFDKRSGSGTITGLTEFGNITLSNASISRINEAPFQNGSQIEGTATSAKLGNGSYALGFFGPQAEEIAGRADFTRSGNDALDLEEQDLEIGFGGKR